MCVCKTWKLFSGLMRNRIIISCDEGIHGLKITNFSHSNRECNDNAEHSRTVYIQMADAATTVARSAAVELPRIHVVKIVLSAAKSVGISMNRAITLARRRTCRRGNADGPMSGRLPARTSEINAAQIVTP